VIFGRHLPGISLQLCEDRDIIKKSVFQDSGKRFMPETEKRFDFFLQF